VTIAKVNVDEEPALAARFGVQAIPQLVFFKYGVEKDRLVGAAPKREIVKRLDTLRD
jgi:thioredoxin 1